MSKVSENAKLAALQRVLQFKNDPKMLEMVESMKYGGRKWGNIIYAEEEEAKSRETPEERAAREAKLSEKFLKIQMEGNIAKKKARFVTKTGLKKIAKACKWECEAGGCWAHTEGACPFIHKGNKGSSESTAVRAANAGKTSGKKKRTSTQRRRRNSRRATRKN